MTGGLQSQADERSSNSAVVSSGKRDLLGEHRSLFTGALGGTTWAVFQCSQCWSILAGDAASLALAMRTPAVKGTLYSPRVPYERVAEALE